MTLTEVLTAIGLFLVIEGLLYAAAPDFMRRLMSDFLAMADEHIRYAGVAAAAVGVFVIWLAIG